MISGGGEWAQRSQEKNCKGEQGRQRAQSEGRSREERAGWTYPSKAGLAAGTK